MAEPVRTQDFPTYDVYPGPESPRTPRVGKDYTPTTWEQGPGAQGAARDSGLDETAEQIGSTLGRAVRAIRELPQRAQQAGTDMRDRLTVIRERRGATAQGKISELKASAQEKLDETKDRAVRLAGDARERARRFTNERPLHVLLGIFVAGFIAGVVIRLGRNRE